MAPTRRPGSPPIVTIDVSPAYELLKSIITVIEHEEAETYDIGPDWIAEARARAGEELLDRVQRAAHGHVDVYIHLMGLVWDTPAPRTIPAFLEHLRRTDPDEIRRHMVQFYSRDARRQTQPGVMRAALAGDEVAQAEFLRTSYPEYEPWTQLLRALFAADPEASKAELIDVLEEWAERVWKPESLTIQPIIERDAEAKRALLRELPVDRFITTATNGVEFEPRPGTERIVMVPSFVGRPLVSWAEVNETLLISYPVADESVTAETDAPPLRLVRLSKALGDEKRLRILRALSEGEKSLMELAEMFGVAKTTMHHHMIVLRTAGLISVVVGTKRYRLRHESVPDVAALLSGYLGAAPGPSAASRSPAPVRRRRRTGTEG